VHTKKVKNLDFELLSEKINELQALAGEQKQNKGNSDGWPRNEDAGMADEKEDRSDYGEKQLEYNPLVALIRTKDDPNFIDHIASFFLDLFINARTKIQETQQVIGQSTNDRMLTTNNREYLPRAESQAVEDEWATCPEEINGCRVALPTAAHATDKLIPCSKINIKGTAAKDTYTYIHNRKSTHSPPKIVISEN